MYFWNDLDRYAERTALITDDGTALSYAELLARADEIGRAAGGRTLAFLMAANAPECVACYVGFLRARVVPVLVSEQTAPDLLRLLMEAYRPALFFLPEDRAASIDGSVVMRDGRYALLRTSYERDCDLAPDLAVLLTTSGSTGSPKLVRQTAANVEANTRSIIDYLGITADDRAITTLPMYYTYGLSIIQTHLCAGAALILSDAALTEKRFWSLLREQRATTFGGVPYIYEMLKRLRFERMDLPSIRYLTQAGGKLSPELAAEFIDICARKDIKFIIMYGQTEATARMSWLPWEHAAAKSSSIGVAIPSGEFWLADESGARVEGADAVGELIYRGPNVTPGYAENRADLCRGNDNGGVLHTGDMARRDADGFYYVVGRKKRFLKIFGSRVNLDEVEGLVKGAGFECAVAGVDDRLRVFITNESQASAVNDFLSERTSINHAGMKVVVIPEIPRSESGKVLYGELEKLA